MNTCAMDKACDITTLYDGCEERGCRPVMPLRETPAVKWRCRAAPL